MKKLLFMLFMGSFMVTAFAQERLPEYTQARRFTAEKLKTMLFSTSVDPHWTPKGDRFWYSYKTGEGTTWYLVDAATRTKRPLFNQVELAAQLTEIVKDPYIAEQLPIQSLRATEDGNFTFRVISSQDTKKKDEKGKKKKGKEIFYFSYNPDTQKLTLLDQDEPEKFPMWASISPDGQTVVYAKDLNLYSMSRADYEKAKKDEKDSTIVETQLTKFGVKDFGFGQPYRYALQRQTQRGIHCVVARLETLCHHCNRQPQGERTLGYQFHGTSTSYIRDLQIPNAGRERSSTGISVRL
jgi:dipeptidyl-peptidase-4